MSQQETKSWVLVSSVNKDTNTKDLQNISPQISKLVDEWHSKGKVMRSGVFDNNVSYMAVFEATEQEAKEFFKKFENICSGTFTYEIYQWDAKPILSVLSK